MHIVSAFEQNEQKLHSDELVLVMVRLYFLASVLRAVFRLFETKDIDLCTVQIYSDVSFPDRT